MGSVCDDKPGLINPERAISMRVVCSWCGITLQEGTDEVISHGICADCKELVLRQGDTVSKGLDRTRASLGSQVLEGFSSRDLKYILDAPSDAERFNRIRHIASALMTEEDLKASVEAGGPNDV